MNRTKMPTPETWLAAIEAHGFEMEMDVDFDVEDFEGFLPCKYKGEDAGFEYWAEKTDVNALAADGMLEGDEVTELGDSDFLVTLSTHADYRELITSMIAAAVLAELSGGQLAPGGEPPFLHGAQAVEKIREDLPGLEREL
ncbi:MAG: hypothetical protein AB8G16_17245 [Gammaproteobacteria bacterium]